MGTVRVTQEYNEILFATPYTVTAREYNKSASSTLAAKQLVGISPVRRYERFANNAGSSLSADIDSDDTILTVASGAGFPVEGNFRIIIDDEILLVTKVVGISFTVVRSSEGTTAASHTSGTGVFHVVTAGALSSRDNDATALDLFISRDAPGQAGRLYIPTAGYVGRDSGTVWESMPLWRLVPPVVGDFTWVNQGSATTADAKGSVVFDPGTVASGSSLRMLVKSAPATPYSITMCFFGLNGPKNGSTCYGQYGVCWRDSASGKVITWSLGTDTNSSNYLYYTRWTNPTTVTTQVSQTKLPFMNPYWLRATDDGTNRLVEWSGDGYKFNAVAVAESRTTHLTANQVGFFADSYLASTVAHRLISFLHWSQS